MSKAVSHFLALLASLVWVCGVIAQEEISTDSLPDIQAPKLSPELDRRRVDDLLKSIPHAQNLDNFFPSDLSRLEVQKAIVTQNPFLVTLFPPQTELLEEPMQILAAKFYRFDFFIPIYLRKQDSVKKAFKANAKKYVKDFRLHLETAQKFLHEGEGRSLIHPDFFYDSTFVFIFMHMCSAGRTPPNFHMPERYIKPQLVKYEPLDSFYYFSKKNIFDNLHQKIFISKHPSSPLLDKCYPKDYLSDTDFIKTMNSKVPSGNFIAKGIANNDSATIKEMYYEDLVTKLNTKNYNDRIINTVKPEEWKVTKLEEWLFSHPEAFIKLDIALDLNPLALENFIKSQYKPGRFFSKTQKQSKLYADLLEKYPNTSEETIKVSKELAINQFANTLCCGPSYQKDIRDTLKQTPEEFFQDMAFISTILEQKPNDSEFLIELINVHGVSKELKELLLNKCRGILGIKRIVLHPTLAPPVLTKDKSFMKNLKASCM